jgi:hypothetical protein
MNVVVGCDGPTLGFFGNLLKEGWMVAAIGDNHSNEGS